MGRSYGGDLARTLYADSILDVHKRELHHKDVKLRNLRLQVREQEKLIRDLKYQIEDLEEELEDLREQQRIDDSVWLEELNAEIDFD